VAAISRFIGLLQKLEHRQKLGIQGAMVYDRHRKRIVDAAPTPPLDDFRAEVHLITSKIDWLNALWGLRSFYHFSGERYALCIHEDGSLGQAEFAVIERLFPGCRIITEDRALGEIIPWLSDYPRCQLLRKLKFISKKEFDFNYYLKAPLGILFDSDLIFYGRPDFVCDELIAGHREGNWVNRDVSPGLSITSEEILQKFGFEVPAHYNTGWGTWHRGSIRNDDLEAFLEDFQVLDHPWRFEQSLHALCSGKQAGAHLLPQEYDVYWGELKPDPVMRHYVGAIRHLLFSEGVRKLAPILAP
jgi:hypothetical protein